MSIIRPGLVEGTVTIPGSKSVTQRAIALATFARGRSTISEPGWCADTEAALDVSRKLGAAIETTPNTITVAPPDSIFSHPLQSPLQFGESGTAFRIFAPLLALGSKPAVLAGKGSLQRRTMTPLIEAMRSFGARCDSANDLPPLTVCGPLRGGKATVDCSITSQPLSGLLLALPLAQQDSEITVSNPTSLSYIRLTLDLVRQFGCAIEADSDLKQFFIFGRQHYQGTEIRVEGDWSGAAFVAVAGAIAGSIKMRNLLPGSSQGDRVILDFLKQAGAYVGIEGGEIEVTYRPLRAIDVDCTDCPDLVPPLVALASCAEGTSTIAGISRLKHKESDRVTALLDLCERLGVKGSRSEDKLSITGGKIESGTIDPYNDHRIAMTAVVMGLRASGSVTVNKTECIAKSYPTFIKDLLSIYRTL